MFMELDHLPSKPKILNNGNYKKSPYDAVLCGFVKINEMQKALEILHIMAKRHVLPDSDTMSIVVDFLSKDEQYKKHVDCIPTFVIKV